MKKYPLAIFIGRFQPFHNGHLYSLKKAAEAGEKVIIGIGSSQESGTDNNPWSFEERKKMAEAVLSAESLQGLALKVVGIPDFETDEEWVAEVKKAIGEYRPEQTIVVGNNEWTNGVLAEAGFAVLLTGLHNRDELEGTKIRLLMREGKDSWKERVPREVLDLI